MMINQLQLYRQSQPTVTIPIDENTIYFDECMGRFDIECQFYSPVPLDIRVDDYIIYNGVRFTINVPYQVTRTAVIQYHIRFEHPSYWLKDRTAVSELQTQLNAKLAADRSSGQQAT